MIYFHDRNFFEISNPVKYDSLIWTERYYDPGDFELIVLLDETLPKWLEIGNYVTTDQSNVIMVIESFEVNYQPTGDKLKIIGRDVTCLLERRIFYEDVVIDNQSIDTVLKNAINTNIIAPSTTNRKINSVIYKTSTDSRVTELLITDLFEKGDNLLEEFLRIQKINKVGFYGHLFDENKIQYGIYMGYEKTDVELSTNFNNMSDGNYVETSRLIKNHIYVQGEEVSVEVGNTTGLDRYEMYVNDSGVADTAELTKKGEDTIKENSLSKVIDGTMDVGSIFKYGRDFFLGDIITVDIGYGIKDKVRCIEMIYSHDLTGEHLYPSFENIEEEV